MTWDDANKKKLFKILFSAKGPYISHFCLCMINFNLIFPLFTITIFAYFSYLIHLFLNRPSGALSPTRQSHRGPQLPVWAKVTSAQQLCRLVACFSLYPFLFYRGPSAVWVLSFHFSHQRLHQDRGVRGPTLCSCPGSSVLWNVPPRKQYTQPQATRKQKVCYHFLNLCTVWVKPGKILHFLKHSHICVKPPD